MQSKNPARWLDHEQAFTDLLGACQDGTTIGLRDEVAIRLGLAGMRVHEVGTLTMRNLRLAASPPTVEWTGKQYRPRRVVIGANLAAALRRYLDLYTSGLNRPWSPDDVLICRRPYGLKVHRYGPHAGQTIDALAWGEPFKRPRHSVWDIVVHRARLAGLGHVTPHDLRRTTAGILHRDIADNGAHRFDLLDIQKVLGHADPATTMRSYLDPMDTTVIQRAASVLD